MIEIDEKEILYLEKRALNIRGKILRLIKAGKVGHVGGAMSAVEILTALYFKIMKIDIKSILISNETNQVFIKTSKM